MEQEKIDTSRGNKGTEGDKNRGAERTEKGVRTSTTRQKRKRNQGIYNIAGMY